MRRIGADMLANLDRQLADGTMTKAEYDSRRIEVEDLIRKGKDIDMTPAEKYGRLAGGFAVFCVVAVILGLIIPLPAPVSLFIGAVVGLVVGIRVASPRAR